MLVSKIERTKVESKSSQPTVGISKNRRNRS
jgi:hypothetical protein